MKFSPPALALPSLALPSLSLIFSGIAVATIGGAATASPGGDAELGQRLYVRCVACHATSAQAPAKMGPHLQSIVGRKSASVAGFRYSPALTKAKVTWTEARLDKWLQGPQAVVPGTAMVFSGMPDAADRKALIAYLKRMDR